MHGNYLVLGGHISGKLSPSLSPCFSFSCVFCLLLSRYLKTNPSKPFNQPLIWVTSRTAQIVLATLLIVIDVCRIDLLELAIRGRIYEFQQRRAEGKKGLGMKGWHRMPDLPQGYKIPVMNIEHAVERLGAFVVIVVSLSTLPSRGRRPVSG